MFGREEAREGRKLGGKQLALQGQVDVEVGTLAWLGALGQGCTGHQAGGGKGIRLDWTVRDGAGLWSGGRTGT